MFIFFVLDEKRPNYHISFPTKVCKCRKRNLYTRVLSVSPGKLRKNLQHRFLFGQKFHRRRPDEPIKLKRPLHAGDFSIVELVFSHRINLHVQHAAWRLGRAAPPRKFSVRARP